MLDRIKSLFIKLVSIKGVLFIVSTVLVFLGIIAAWMWFASGVLVVSSRMFEKIILKIFDKYLPK